MRHFRIDPTQHDMLLPDDTTNSQLVLLEELIQAGIENALLVVFEGDLDVCLAGGIGVEERDEKGKVMQVASQRVRP